MDLPPPELSERIRSFCAEIKLLGRLPSWSDAAAMGVELINLSREEASDIDVISDLIQARSGFDAIVDPQLQSDLIEDLRDYEARLQVVIQPPNRFHLATGESVTIDPRTLELHALDRWTTREGAALITTPSGERFHLPGIHRAATIHPSALIAKSARLEAGVHVAEGARIGPYAHVGHEASVGSNSVLNTGAWVGPGSALWPTTWVSAGAKIGARSVIGGGTHVGAGAQVKQRSEIEPHSRVPPNSSTSRISGSVWRGAQVANALQQLLHLDRE